METQIDKINKMQTEQYNIYVEITIAHSKLKNAKEIYKKIILHIAFLP